MSSTRKKRRASLERAALLCAETARAERHPLWDFLLRLLPEAAETSPEDLPALLRAVRDRTLSRLLARAHARTVFCARCHLPASALEDHCPWCGVDLHAPCRAQLARMAAEAEHRERKAKARPGWTEEQLRSGHAALEFPPHSSVRRASTPEARIESLRRRLLPLAPDVLCSAVRFDTGAHRYAGLSAAIVPRERPVVRAIARTVLAIAAGEGVGPPRYESYPPARMRIIQAERDR